MHSDPWVAIAPQTSRSLPAQAPNLASPPAELVSATWPTAHHPTATPNLSATATPPSDPETLARYGLPTYPHPQYQYTVMGGLTPSGPLYSMEPFLNRIAAGGGWSAATAANANPAPVIAVIDTGFALKHQALAGRWAGSGWNFINGTNNPMAGTTNPNGSAVFHGTMTAGLSGLLDPNAKILPLQALSDDGVGYTDQIAAAVRYAADSGVRVISLSLGTNADDAYLHSQIDYAISKGVVVVAAAGNNGCNCLSYPAAYPEVLSVGASSSGDARASFSSYGASLDVLAPGTAGDVCSSFYLATNVTSAYSCSYSGTSFATPLVSGLAALLLQQNPAVSPSGLIAAVTQSADKVPEMGSQYQTLADGYGRIDVARAIAAVSIKAPGGELLSKQVISLTSTNGADSPDIISTCTGLAGAVCDIVLTGPSGQTVDLGLKSLDATYGGAVYSWNAATLGLAPGQWTITGTESGYYNQATNLPPQSLTISP